MQFALDQSDTLEISGHRYRYWPVRNSGITEANLRRLPYSLRVLLENLLRHHGRGPGIGALVQWSPSQRTDQEVSFYPARVLLQDFTGVPCVVDLAAMRDAMADLGGDPQRINPMLPVELVIDHSVQVDFHGTPDALEKNVALEFQRNRERYAFLKWGQRAFRNFRVVPPSTGIVHQVNLEYLARVVFVCQEHHGGLPAVYPDTLVGTDSHTTMVNGLGVLGWGVGGIEAEAAMLGQPLSMLIPPVIGVRLTGTLPASATATDLVLTITQILRQYGVVGCFVEFFGPGAATLSVADRATVANMAPEYGATCGYFPVDAATLEYLRLTGRDAETVAIVEAYTKAQSLYRNDSDPEPEYTDVVEVDLKAIQPSAAGPRRPQDRVALGDVPASFAKALPSLRPPNHDTRQKKPFAEILDGAVAIAAITSCTNTSNPSVMVTAGLLARNAVRRGLKIKPWVKASLTPGSPVVTEYLRSAGLLDALEQLGFYIAGYGCTTCIGNSGPLLPAVSRAVQEDGLVVASVLSGNRNFEGRVQQEVRANYLMSPPLVVAYALAGAVTVNLTRQPLGLDRDGRAVMLEEIYPSRHEVEEVIRQHVAPEQYLTCYRDVFSGDRNWQEIPSSESVLYQWDPSSTYIKRPPYFDGLAREAPERAEDICDAHVLLFLGDSITTDHISPAGRIPASSPAGQWLIAHGVEQSDFNSYGSRRGHDEVMVRGTFANVRIRNRLAPGTEGGFTTYLPTGELMTVFDAAMRYHAERIPLIVLAGKEYGSGSSRDWAAKGPSLLGVRAVLAESFERIHRSNLVGMGIAPLQFFPGENADSLGLTGHERFTVTGVDAALRASTTDGRAVQVEALTPTGEVRRFSAKLRVDTPAEVEYYRHGGILQYVLRQLLNEPQ